MYGAPVDGLNNGNHITIPRDEKTDAVRGNLPCPFKKLISAYTRHSLVADNNGKAGGTGLDLFKGNLSAGSIDRIHIHVL